MATSTRNPENAASQERVWFVKNEQGGRFGPVGLETLKAWACDGRIGPTNEVSSDGMKWQPAPLLSDLEMEWVAEVTPGNYYGPIHRSAMRSLVAEGSISRQAFVFKKAPLDEDEGNPEPQSDGDTRPDDAAIVDYGRVIEDRDARLRQAQVQINALQEELCALRHTADEQAAQSRLASEQTSAGAALLSQARKELEEQVFQSGKKVSALESQLQAVRQQVADSEGLVAGLRLELERQAKQAAEDLGRERSKAGDLERRLAESESALEGAQGKLDRAAAEQKARAAEWESVRLGLEAERRLLRDEITRALSETAERTARIAALEAVLAETLREGSLKEERAEVSLKAYQAELIQVQQQLAEQSVMLKAADAEKTELEKRVEEIRQSRAKESSRLSAVTLELQASRQEAQSLRESLEALRRRPETRDPVVETREVEVLEAEIVEELPHTKSQASRQRVVVEAEVLPPERDLSSAKPQPAPSVNPSGRGKSGLSLAELEQQARRELERLGPHGHAFFMKKK